MILVAGKNGANMVFEDHQVKEWKEAKKLVALVDEIERKGKWPNIWGWITFGVLMVIVYLISMIMEINHASSGDFTGLWIYGFLSSAFVSYMTSVLCDKYVLSNWYWGQFRKVLEMQHASTEHYEWLKKYFLTSQDFLVLYQKYAHPIAAKEASEAEMTAG